MTGSVEPFQISTMTEDARTRSMATVERLGAKTYVGVPVVRNDGSIFGTLCALDSESQNAPPASLELLALLARLCAYQFELDEVLQAQTRARAQLESLTEELIERNRFEQQLIGIVSHDLKSPLTAIITSAALLVQNERLDEAAKRSAARLRSSAERAARMVHDLLGFTEARHAGIEIDPQPAVLGDIVAQAVGDVQMGAPGRRIDVRCPKGISGRWDADRIVQVLANLVDNAATYGAEGTAVTVEADASEAQVVVRVHNEGPPVPEEILPTIFEPLVRGHAGSRKRSIGLGLFIVKHLTEAHGGSVTVTSSAAQGTTFEVRLPRYVSDARADDPARDRKPARLVEGSVGDGDERLDALTSPAVTALDTDAELQRIAQNAAEHTDSPAAAVNLILNRTQLIRAHFGILPELERSRAIDRNLSFCQFVVRDRAPFEVNDALTDGRVPREIVERLGVRSYYGVPVYVGSHVAGALCVFDSRPRHFTAAERQDLAMLARQATARLTEIGGSQTERAELLSDVTVPAFSELRNLLTPLHLQLQRTQIAFSELRPLLGVVDAVERGETMQTAIALLSDTRRAFNDAERAVSGLSSVALRLRANVLALEHVLAPRGEISVNELVDAVVSLTTHHTRGSGGVLFPAELPRGDLAHPRAAISALAAAVLALSDAVSRGRRATTVSVEMRRSEASLEVRLSAPMLADVEIAHVRTKLLRTMQTIGGVEVAAADATALNLRMELKS